MTQQEFDFQRWGVGMKIIYLRDWMTYDVVSVDFMERLVGYKMDGHTEINWARCENVKIVS